MLIRIPGIGIRGARKIMSSRRIRYLDFYDLKKLRITLKRAQFFITCRGKYFGSVKFDNEKIRNAIKPESDLNLIDSGEQLSFFDITKQKLLDDTNTSLSGEL